MSTTTELKKGSYFIHNGKIVEVLRREVIAYGTHSHSKLKIYFKGLAERGEKNVNLHHTDRVEIVDIMKKTGQVVSKSNGKVQVMDSMSYETLDASAPEELLNKLEEGNEVSFIDFNGNVQIIDKIRN